MHCPYCRHTDSRVVDSRTSEDGSSIRRRRQCPECGRRFTTVETTSLSVVKRSGVVEPFSRDKVVAGVRKACQGRPVTDDSLALLAQRVEEVVRASGVAEVEAHDVGLAILGPLRELDVVAYLRFASVYQNFSSLADFTAAIDGLRGEQAALAAAAAGTERSEGGAERTDEGAERTAAGAESSTEGDPEVSRPGADVTTGAQAQAPEHAAVGQD